MYPYQVDPRYKELVEQLASPVQEHRDLARTSLAASGIVAVPALVEALEHPERDARAGACMALAVIRDPRAAPTLIALCREDDDTSVRQLALRALAAAARPGADQDLRDCLQEHLNHPDMFSRALACEGLGRIGDEPSRRALTQTLSDHDEWVRSAAADALAKGAGEAPDTSRTKPPPPASGDRERPARPSSEVEDLLRELQSLDVKVQRRAQALLFQRGPEVIPKLTPVVLEGPTDARRAAVEVLALLGRAESLHALALLLDQDPLPGSLRPAALHAVARVLGKEDGPVDPQLLTRLRHHLGHEDAHVRAGAVAALVSAGPDPRRQVLSWMIAEEEDPWVTLAACRALSRAATLDPGDQELLPALTALLTLAEDQETHICLLETLTRLMKPAAAENEPMVAPVSGFLESESPDVRRAASRLLARCAPAVDRPTLVILLRMLEEDPDGREDLVQEVARLTPPGDPLPVPALRRLMRGGEEVICQRTVEALARVGGRAAVEALVEVANSRSGPVVALASRALTKLPPRGDIVALRGPNGTWRAEERSWCECGGVLRWVSRDRREQLRCPQCDAEYVQAARGKVFAAGATPFGACLCPGCRRKRPLIREGMSQVLVCPESGLVHVRPFDHPNQLRLIKDLPLGACRCCDEPQPLIRVDGQVVCYRTREPSPDHAYTRPGSPKDEIAAINDALLQGTLGLAGSGLAVDGDDEE